MYTFQKKKTKPPPHTHTPPTSHTFLAQERGETHTFNGFIGMLQSKIDFLGTTLTSCGPCCSFLPASFFEVLFVVISLGWGESSPLSSTNKLQGFDKQVVQLKTLHSVISGYSPFCCSPDLTIQHTKIQRQTFLNPSLRPSPNS